MFKEGQYSKNLESSSPEDWCGNAVTVPGGENT